MRTALISLLILFTIVAFSQEDTVLPKQKDTVSLQEAMDSANEYLKELRSKEWEDRNTAGLQLLMKQQNERRAKEKKAAMIRIGIGVLFLVILVIGLRRKRKKPVS